MEHVQEILQQIDPAGLHYNEWIAVGMAIKAEGLDCGVWDEWSRRDPARWRKGDCERHWKSFESAGITGGTLVHMAKERGWRTPTGSDNMMGWNDVIIDDGDGLPRAAASLRGTEQLKLYLQTLFAPDDYVGYVSESFETSDGSFRPASGGMYQRTAGELIRQLEHSPDDIAWTIGDYNKSAGCWIRFNPLDGRGAKNENVTQYRYALVECDSIDIAEQERLYRQLELPIAAMVYSGKKSIHAIVRIDAGDADAYKERVLRLYDFLASQGLEVDRQNKNPSRLSRLPGVMRGGQEQKLLAVNIGRKSWADWITGVVERVEDELPEPENLGDLLGNPPPLAPELIHGILRRGHKMLISGSSKAGKSFTLMELCVAFATGGDWLGFQCARCKVLYVNLEIDRASCINRFLEIMRSKGLDRPAIGDRIVVWSLRGKAVPLDQLVPKLIRRMRENQFGAVIIDPIYKVIMGDENNASDMAKFCNQFDRIAEETGCSVIYCHHHSKGAQGAKRAMDRASGSGVFARDPDAQLDMIELELTDAVRNTVADHPLDTAWRLESSLREFPNIKPVNFWFRYPVHEVDGSGRLEELSASGSAAANLAKSPNRTSAESRLHDLRTAFDVLQENGTAEIGDVAEYCGRTKKTIRSWIEEYEDLFFIKGGTIFKAKDGN